VPPSPPRPAAGPLVRATVVTIRTIIDRSDPANPTNPSSPATKTLTHTLTFTTNRARSSDEIDHWRLFDLRSGRVTFVDDIARTYRSEAAASLRNHHRRLLAVELPENAPHVSIAASGAKRTFVQGIEARQYLITVGAYRRELWIASQSPIPSELFATMLACETPSSPLAGMAREVDEALLAIRGFPMLDHSELSLGHGAKYVIDRAVVDIRQQDVPASYLNVGAGYRDVTLTEPDASLPPASSPLRDRSTPAEGWPPSVTTRKTP
jgi:hypothetical protein